MTKKQIDPFELDKEEKEIEDAIERGEYKRVDDFDKEVSLAREAARNYFKKNKNVNIRITQADLYRLKKIALDEGLPYQTLIGSILHKVATGQLELYSKKS